MTAPGPVDVPAVPVWDRRQFPDAVRSPAEVERIRARQRYAKLKWWDKILTPTPQGWARKR